MALKVHQLKELLWKHPELVGTLGKTVFNAVDEVTYELVDETLLWQHQTKKVEYVLMSKEGEFLAQVGRGLIPLLKNLFRLGPELVIDAVTRIMRKEGDVFGYIISLHDEERSGDRIVRPPRMVIHELRNGDMRDIVKRALKTDP